MHYFGNAGFFYGINENSSYGTDGSSTISSNNTLSFFDPHSAPTAPYETRDINWSTSYSAGSIYEGYNAIAQIPMIFTTPDNNLTIYDGNTTLYSDTKGEFFVNFVEVNASSPFNQAFYYLETAGKRSNYDITSFPSSVIYSYKTPYPSYDNLMIRFDNQNFILIPTSDMDNALLKMSIAVGRMVNDNGYIALRGNYQEFSNFFEENMSSSISGHIYGSEYQGVDLFGIGVDQNETYNIGGFAGYKTPVSTIATPLSNEVLSLQGYATAYNIDSSLYQPISQNFSFEMNTTTGQSLGGNIYLGGTQVVINTDSISDIKSAYIDRNVFATLDFSGGQGWLLSNSNDLSYGNAEANTSVIFPQNYIYWGYYSFSDGNSTEILPSPWVAGSHSKDADKFTKNIINHNLTNTSLFYKGQMLGHAVYADANVTNIYLINTNSGTNIVSLKFDFGSSTGIDTNAEASYISFDTNDTWNIVFNPSSLSSGDFNLTVNNEQSTLNNSTDANITGSVNGNFYGPDIESAGGAIALNTDTNITVSGIFMANYDHSYSEVLFGYPKLWSVQLDNNSTSSAVKLTGYSINVEQNTLGSYEPTIGGITLDINGSNDSLGSLSEINGSTEDFPISLAKDVNSSTMTYIDINNFAIKDFNSTNGWIQTDTNSSDYVSWGYWEMDNIALVSNEGNYWVAGVDAGLADINITGLINNSATTSYTYSGSVIGAVKDNARNLVFAIDPTTNNQVTLNFDFGGGSGSLKAGSIIQFQTKEDIPHIWTINPSGSVNGGSFSIINTNNVVVDSKNFDGTTQSNISDSTIKGTFYGDKAQAVGGAFKANIPGQTAVGVFKANKIY